MKPRKPPNPQNNRSRKRAIAIRSGGPNGQQFVCVPTWSFISWNSIIGYIANNRESFDFITAHVHQSSRVLRSYIRQPQEAAQWSIVCENCVRLKWKKNALHNCFYSRHCPDSISFLFFGQISTRVLQAYWLLAIYRINYIIMLSLLEGIIVDDTILSILFFSIQSPHFHFKFNMDAQ